MGVIITTQADPTQLQTFDLIGRAEKLSTLLSSVSLCVLVCVYVKYVCVYSMCVCVYVCVWAFVMLLCTRRRYRHTFRVKRVSVCFTPQLSDV